ncbi:Membrane protein OS=Salmonella enterica subsp. enterica serovar Thompson str. RM6836 GN=IA1_04270 PE=4 SV=1 [Gemmataceae bacterium]|nr:Membrane protein OS=Salmonella enterica subsp. enterica serovar Thompson str. RM6836 GN=IA1_04270 PE=4 SV=1 [Gemmataceae bacterium]VTT97295.1 Membrane protein OS=Salmonella enterica subsp. enterica serovar Thompson str. RM6836 GN=IA1_04270 PE=4 SV=1 [Gemmataceae bacterium]
MDFKDRFFGRATPAPGGPPVANPRLTDPPGLILLLSEVPAIDTAHLAAVLRDYHAEFAGVSVEFAPEGPNAIGLIGWGRHAVKVVVFHSPAPQEVVQTCVVPAHYDPATKDEAFRAAAHALLFYAGYDPDPHEQFVALAAAAAGLTHFGGVVVMNERAQTSIPALALLPHAEDNGDPLRTLRTFPLPLLYAGFVKMEVEGDPGVWMRTCGCGALRLPDLAIRADAHTQGTATFNLFANLLAHLREAKTTFIPGDTLNVGEGMYLRVRERAPDEWFLESDGTMLVLERLAPEEVPT